MPIGHHVMKNNRKMHVAIEESIKRALQHNLTTDCAQIFVIGPQNTKETLSLDEKEKISKFVAENDEFTLLVHGCYLDNICGSKPEFALHLIKKELQICSEIKAKGLVIHLPKRDPAEVAGRVAEIVKYVPDSVILYLEIESYKPNEYTYETKEKLENLKSQLELKINEKNMSKIGLCIDTAHLWAAGVDIQTYELAEKYINDTKNIFEHTIIHLNDQINALGSGRDEHAPLAYGTIWGKYRDNMQESGLAAILNFIDKNDICAILERKADKPKIDGLPLEDNVISDFKQIKSLGFDFSN